MNRDDGCFTHPVLFVRTSHWSSEFEDGIGKKPALKLIDTPEPPHLLF